METTSTPARKGTHLCDAAELTGVGTSYRLAIFQDDDCLCWYRATWQSGRAHGWLFDTDGALASDYRTALHRLTAIVVDELDAEAQA